MGPVAVPNEPPMVPKPHHRQSRPSDNSHGQLGEDSHQCHLFKARQTLLQSELYRAMKKPSGKADLAIYCHSIVVSG